MGRLFTVTLEGKIYTCKHCGTHLALHEDFISRTFKAEHGEAYVFSKIVNVTRGKSLDITGLHSFAVIFCVGCGAMNGWTYVCNHENSQNCKEGKSILDRRRLSFQEVEGPSPNHEARVGGSDADDG